MTVRKWTVPVLATAVSLALLIGACAPAPPRSAAPTVAPAAKAGQPPQPAAGQGAQPSGQGATSTPAQAGQASKTAPVAEGPRRGGTLVLPLQTDPSTLNCGVESSQVVAAVTSSIFSGLVLLDDKGNPHPDLAERWDISPDGLTYTFHLRKNVTWHDGKPLTSDDVKFSFEHLTGKYNARGRAAYNNIGGIDTPNDTTAVFRLKAPYEPLLRILSAHNGCIMPKHLYQEGDVLTNPHNEKPIGSGPFRFSEWQKGSHLTLVRNESYFKKGRPFLDSIIYKIVPDPSSRAIAFTTGEVSALMGSQMFPFAQLAQLQGLPNVIYRDIGDATVIGVNFNLEGNPIVAKHDVRLAIAHALEKKVIVDNGFLGSGKVVDSVIPDGIPWAYNPNVPRYAHDVGKANALLDGAGYPRKDGGVRFSLGLTYEAGNANSERPVEVVKEQLRRVGVDVKLNRLDRSVMLKKVFEEYDYDMWWGPLTTNGHPALGVARLYMTSAINGGAFQNFTRYRNARVDELFALAVSSTNEQEVVKAYHEIQEIILKELPSIPVADRVQANIISDQFRGGLSSTEVFERTDEIWWLKGTPVRDGEYEPVPTY